MLYFAYGSNLNIEQMDKRCPAAKPVTGIIIPNWRLVFRGYADIEPCENATLLGGLWEITKECEKTLDRYEGVNGGLYRKCYFKYQDQDVLFYRMNETGIYYPAPWYIEVIKEGYDDFGLDLADLSAAVDHAYKHGTAIFDFDDIAEEDIGEESRYG